MIFVVGQSVGDKPMNTTTIELNYTHANLLKVLSDGEKVIDPIYTHWDIAKWCDNFFMTFLDSENESLLDVCCGIATDVDTQWDLYLWNLYNLDDLKTIDLSEIIIPNIWFSEWIQQLKSAQQGDAPEPASPAR